MKSIVTGGAGFIGSNLCRYLAEQNHEVFSIDDYSAGYEKNLKGLDVTQIACDVTDYDNMRKALSRIGEIDYIFHQAASKKNICLRDPMRDLEVNAKGTFNVAQMAMMFDAKMVHASTGSVYGESVGVQHELHPVNPVSYYGVSKLAGEKYVAMLMKKGLRAAILRYFHVYGPNQEDRDDTGGVIAIWIRRIKQDKPIVLFGDGTQMRSFTHVDDVCRANVLAAAKGDGVYNCVSGHMYSLNDLIDELREYYTSKQICVIKKDWLDGDIKDFKICNKKIEMLGMDEWKDLENGLWDTEYLIKPTMKNTNP